MSMHPVLPEGISYWAVSAILGGWLGAELAANVLVLLLFGK